MPTLTFGGHTYEMHVDPVEVTMMSRPDPSWKFTDAAGHVHQWYCEGQTATVYDPTKRYSVPSVVWVVDVEATDEYPEHGHHECKICRANVDPGECSDEFRQFIPGLKTFYIDGERVTAEEFERQGAIVRAKLAETSEQSRRSDDGKAQRKAWWHWPWW